MTHEVLESISQRINGTEVEKNCRIYEIANELSRRCRICKCELREGEKHASEIDIERIVTERYAKEIDCWIPMEPLLSAEEEFLCLLLPSFRIQYFHYLLLA